MIKWPGRDTVHRTLLDWVREQASQRPELQRAGYFGSYAHGNWGVGSDLDILLVVSSSDRPFEQRASQWEPIDLPVPFDILVYTKDEWQALAEQGGKFYRTVEREGVWVYDR